MNYNKVVLMGRVVADAEYRQITDEVGVATFTLAVQDNRKTDTTSFFECKVWRKQADVARMYVKKGMPLQLEGKLIQERWETSDGKKRSKIVIQTTMINFLGSAPAQSKEADPHTEIPPITNTDLPF